MMRKKLYSWLAVSDPCCDSDVIFVLAGRECRKDYALGLFSEGWAPILLMSVGRFEIRGFSKLAVPAAPNLLALASSTQPRLRHYFVELTGEGAKAQRIPLSRFGTLREIRAFADWLRRNNSIRSAMIISSGFHLKRLRLCCQHLVTGGIKLYFVAAPEKETYSAEKWWRNPHGRKLVLSEVLKVAIYKVLLVMLSSRLRLSSQHLHDRTRCA
jgi:DUF218 domain